jgi:hypothetical protein
MAVRRGALRAFHHQVGYAMRRLRHGCPVLAGELLPAVHELQKKIVHISPAVAEKGCDCRWPPWRRPTTETHQHRHPEQELEELQGSVSMAAPLLPLPKRSFQQQDTEETCLNGGDTQTISETEPWADGSSLLDNLSAFSPRRHSRRPRRGRRAKSRRHQQECDEQVAMAVRRCDGPSADFWSRSMATLMEFMEEDLDLDVGRFGSPLVGTNRSNYSAEDNDSNRTPATTR